MIANLFYNIHRAIYSSVPRLLSSTLLHSANEVTPAAIATASAAVATVATAVATAAACATNGFLDTVDMLDVRWPILVTTSPNVS